VIFLILPTLFLTTSVIANDETTEYTMIVLPVYSNDTGPEISIGNLIDKMGFVSEFFDDASYNKLRFEFEIIGWCILPNSMSTYRNETTYPNGVTHITADNSIISENSARSGFVNKEIGYARDKIPIIMLKVSDVSLTGLLNECSLLDARKPNDLIYWSPMNRWKRSQEWRKKKGE
jgi:hypothetical protein